jgi:hypothetical protein
LKLIDKNTVRVTMLLRSAVACAFGGLALAHDFKIHDKVPVLVNTVGPFNNLAETYPFYTLPFCAPAKVYGGEDLGGVLSGDRRRTSLYDVRFQVDTHWQALCSFKLGQDSIKAFIDAIQQHYTFEIFVDDLPVKGFVGEVVEKLTKYDHHTHNETKIYLFTHLDFSLAYNGANVIACNLTTDTSQRVELVYGSDLEVEFSFSTRWSTTNVAHADRLELHSKVLMENQAIEVHWLNIINSFVLVTLLVSYMAIILVRTLKKDMARYLELDDEENFDEEDSGWKLVHGDVFRFPSRPMLFSALVGAGCQWLVLVVSVLFLSLIEIFGHHNRGGVYTAIVLLYALTAYVAGYVSTSLYIQLGGTKWATNAVAVACVFAVPFFVVFSVTNSISISYGTSTSVPFQTIFVILLLWGLVTFPLTVLGSMRGRHTEPFDAPCKTNRVERQIPPQPWWQSTIVQFALSGFLPFSAIYIELHYIFVAVWGHQMYTLFGILCLAFILLVIVTACVTVALTYFTLQAENHRWWWNSFITGTSTGFFMFMYSLYYFNFRSEMSGTLQGAFFLGYMGLISFAFALLLGAVGFFCSLKFVKYIYLSIKID